MWFFHKSKTSKAYGADRHYSIVKYYRDISCHKTDTHGNKQEWNILIQIKLNQKIIEGQSEKLPGIPFEISASPENTVEKSQYFSTDAPFYAR